MYTVSCKRFAKASSHHKTKKTVINLLRGMHIFGLKPTDFFITHKPVVRKTYPLFVSYDNEGNIILSKRT